GSGRAVAAIGFSSPLSVGGGLTPDSVRGSAVSPCFAATYPVLRAHEAISYTPLMPPETQVLARLCPLPALCTAALQRTLLTNSMSHAEKPQRTPVRARETKDDAAGTALTGRFAVLTNWSGLPGGVGRSPRV